jgi:hypothetical protein
VWESRDQPWAFDMTYELYGRLAAGRRPNGRGDLTQTVPDPRLDFVDVPWARGVLTAIEQDRADILGGVDASYPRLLQIEYVMLAEDCKDIGMLKYGLGYPFGETRAAFAEAGKAYLRVFELRGTQTALEVAVVTDQDSKPWHAPGAIDDSLTNSRRGLEAMYVAMVTGDEALARQIAAHVWDPPGASYIGPESRVCTPEDQQLSRAVKALLLDRRSSALSQPYVGRPVTSSAKAQAEVIDTLMAGLKTGFIDRLADLLEWHRGQIADAANQKDVELLFSVPGLALCRQALGRGLIELSELPQSDVLLPLVLLDDDAVELP